MRIFRILGTDDRFTCQRAAAGSLTVTLEVEMQMKNI